MICMYDTFYHRKYKCSNLQQDDSKAYSCPVLSEDGTDLHHLLSSFLVQSDLKVAEK